MKKSLVCLVVLTAFSCSSALAQLFTFSNGKVDQYDLCGNFISEFAADPFVIDPTGIDVGPDGNLYIASDGNDNVLKYTPGGEFLGSFLIGGDLVRVNQLAFGADGNLYVADRGRIKKFDGTTGQFIETAIVGSTIASIVDMKFSPDNPNLLFALFDFASSDWLATFHIDFKDSDNNIELDSVGGTSGNNLDGFTFGPGTTKQHEVYIVTNGQVRRFDQSLNLLQTAIFSVLPGNGIRYRAGYFYIHNSIDNRIDRYTLVGVPDGALIDNLQPIIGFEFLVIRGDLNGDGSIDLLDVAPFVEAIGSSNFSFAADINQDGLVNLLDVGPFVELLICG